MASQGDYVAARGDLPLRVQVPGHRPGVPAPLPQLDWPQLSHQALAFRRTPHSGSVPHRNRQRSRIRGRHARLMRADRGRQDGQCGPATCKCGNGHRQTPLS